MSDAGGGGDETTAIATATVADLLWEAVPIQCTPPLPARVGHSIVQTSSSTLHMFGGANEEHTLEEVWEVDMKMTSGSDSQLMTCACTLLDTKFPGIYEFVAVAVPESASESEISSAGAELSNEKKGDSFPLNADRVWVFGGGTQDSDAVKNDVLIFDRRTKNLDTVNVNVNMENSDAAAAPSPRTQGGNKCLVDYEGSKHLAIFGGGVKNNTSADGVLYLLNIEKRAWSRIDVTGNTPQPRQGHIAASLGSKIFIHGGMLGTSLFDDMHMIDLTQSPHAWIPIETATAGNVIGLKPTARAAHNVATIGRDLFVFGGLDASGEGLNDLWRFNTESFEWTQIHYVGCRIDPRVDFALSSVQLPLQLPSTDSDPDAGSEALIIHGGVNPSGIFFSDMFMIRPKKQSQSQTPSQC